MKNILDKITGPEIKEILLSPIEYVEFLKQNPEAAMLPYKPQPPVNYKSISVQDGFLFSSYSESTGYDFQAIEYLKALKEYEIKLKEYLALDKTKIHFYGPYGLVAVKLNL